MEEKGWQGSKRREFGCFAWYHRETAEYEDEDEWGWAKPEQSPQAAMLRRLHSCRYAHRFDDWSDEVSNTKTKTETRRGRIEFNIVLFMDWSLASGCSPPRLSTTQLPSATDRPVFPSGRDFHPSVGAYFQAHLSQALRARLRSVLSLRDALADISQHLASRFSNMERDQILNTRTVDKSPAYFLVVPPGQRPFEAIISLLA
jgi:hypothetical protein